MNRYLMLALLFNFILLPAFSQIKVDSVIGRWEVSRDISPAQAEQKALWEAKREALRRAGVAENVYSVDLNIQQASNLDFSNFYTEISTVQVNGQVRVLSQEIRNHYDPASSRLTKIATISAEVFVPVFSEDMPEFKMKGLQSKYQEGEPLQFTVTPGADCYFRMFVFDSEGGSCFYPNEFEESWFFRSGLSYAFPRNALYEVEKGNKAISYEQNVLLVVATKENILFKSEPTVYNVFKWIYQIPADKRYVAYYSFLTE